MSCTAPSTPAAACTTNKPPNLKAPQQARRHSDMYASQVSQVSQASQASQVSQAPSAGAGAGVSIDSMLIQSARLGLALRREYKRIKKDQDARYYTYVLQLQAGKIYVGNTDNIYQRMLDHFLQSPSSALWVKRHGPVHRILEVSRNCRKEDELYKTLMYMSMFGWQHVRGSSYCKLEMNGPPECLNAFERTRDGDFQYLTNAEVGDVCRVVEDLRAQYNESIDGV